VKERLLLQSVVRDYRELVQQHITGQRMLTELGQAMAVGIGETTARRNAEMVGRNRAEMMRMQAEMTRMMAEMAVSHKDGMAMAVAKTTSSQGSTPLLSPPATASYLSGHLHRHHRLVLLLSLRSLSGFPRRITGLKRHIIRPRTREPGSSSQTSAFTSSALRRMGTMSTGLGVWTMTKKSGLGG
jgi:hypothetical protein